MRLRPAFVVASAALVAGVVACTLNPQPLPPRDFSNEAAGNTDASADGALGTPATNPMAPPADAGADDRDGGRDASDAGDAGDASDDAPDPDGD